MNKETNEEMNKVIAEYMGAKVVKVLNKLSIEHTWISQYKFEGKNKPTTNLYYHNSWDALMPVWQKLRGELDDLSVDEHGMVKDSDCIVAKYEIEKAILSCDITTAHRLIYEAIVYLKNMEK